MPLDVTYFQELESLYCITYSTAQVGTVFGVGSNWVILKESLHSWNQGVIVCPCSFLQFRAVVLDNLAHEKCGGVHSGGFGSERHLVHSSFHLPIAPGSFLSIDSHDQAKAACASYASVTYYHHLLVAGDGVTEAILDL